MDGSQKIPVRIIPALRKEREEGSLPAGPIRAIAAWILHLRGLGAPVGDVRGDEMQKLAEGPLDAAVVNVLGAVAEDLRGDTELVAEIEKYALEFEELAK